MAIHGKKSRIAVGGYDLSGMGHSARQTFSKELAPSDVFLDSDHYNEAGQKTGMFTFEGRQRGDNAAFRQLIEDISLNADNNPEIAFGPNGFGAGGQVFLSEAWGNTLEPGTDNRSVVSITGGFQAHGGVYEGTVLGSPYAGGSGTLLANPTAAPTVSAGTGTYAAGTYLLAYSYVNDAGETLVSPTASVVLGTTGGFGVIAPALPAGAVGVRVYVSSTGGSATTLKLVLYSTTPSSMTISNPPAATATSPRAVNTTDSVLLSIISATGNGAVHDRGAAYATASATGWFIQSNLIRADNPAASISVAFHHSATGAFAGEQVLLGTLGPFSDIGSARAVSPLATSTLSRYVRAAYTVTGTNARFAVLPTFAWVRPSATQ